MEMMLRDQFVRWEFMMRQYDENLFVESKLTFFWTLEMVLVVEQVNKDLSNMNLNQEERLHINTVSNTQSFKNEWSAKV